MQLIDTKDKNYTVNVDGINLHSKYSPKKEAQRFIDQNIKNSGIVIVLGAALGYIFSAINESLPDVKVISIPYNKELGELSLNINPTQRVQWDKKESIENFLNSVIDEKNIKGLQVVEWNPTSKAFENTAITINKAIVKRIRRVNGNLLTTARFGKRWLTNSVRNFITTDKYISDLKLNRPIIIAASGKSLENSIELIKDIREKITLISLSSANKALEYYGITPDLTFSSDPGYYSKLHLYGFNGIVSMPLTNSTTTGNPVLLINQGNFFEKELIKAGNLPSISLAENGTVAGTALKFALKYSNQKIYLMGQDLQSADIESHIRPYAFDNLLKSKANRLHPYYSIMYKRWIRQGVTYSTYRDWFSAVGTNNTGKIFRVNSKSQQINGIKDIDRTQVLKDLKNIRKVPALIYKEVKISSIKERQEIALKILNKWLKNLENEKIQENNLFYLISTSKYTDVNNKVLSMEAREESILFIKRLLSLYGRQLL